ncbi:MAG: RNA polymerase-binding transcription factor CarD [Alphaproteobacteria bacterium MarineAlpha2_Bin1]|nr:MAG: RNA polymerase-binding transcription factor CarD [Alphaproteobacteria bacterium MarineAlpha2_Bin1]
MKKKTIKKKKKVKVKVKVKKVTKSLSKNKKKTTKKKSLKVKPSKKKSNKKIKIKTKLKKPSKKSKIKKTTKKKIQKKKKSPKKSSIKKIAKKLNVKKLAKKRKKRVSKRNIVRTLIDNKKVKLVANKKPDLSSIKSNDEDILIQYSEFAEKRTQSSVVEKMVRSPILAKKDLIFEKGDQVVYPTHGVGKIVEIQDQILAGIKLQLYVVEFEKDKMTLSVPTAKLASSGMRKLSTRQEMDQALKALKGRARVKRAMWSRRAKEYEDKINSGDPKSIAEVVRDLHRNANQPEQSYSERQIYESALDRLLNELAAVENVDLSEALTILEKNLKKYTRKDEDTDLDNSVKTIPNELEESENNNIV